EDLGTARSRRPCPLARAGAAVAAGDLSGHLPQSGPLCRGVADRPVGMTERRPHPELLSIVCPCYNEERAPGELVNRIGQHLTPLWQGYEIVFVNDGSSDGTLSEMHGLAEREGNITIVNLSRNFGKEIALTAGLCHASGDAVVVIDADLQDPPELIPAFIERYRDGYDIAYGRRIERQGDNWLK